ncbi:chaperonin 10-like protein [Dichotomopilus funicola]|uniref:Chaperonin 10-like protein n=1 Tax=Dichotomopilus funicola TaxID=1934379 RepID=A0AAN6UZQ7_9PEZI|nr:chaperonin 10-like protein [Dichotomopilus funicola]
MSPQLFPSIPPTHAAITILQPNAPLQLTTFPTIPPSPGEALIRVTHTASTPLDMHRAIGGVLLENHLQARRPFIMGTTFGGIVAALGGDATDGSKAHLKIGDAVFGFVLDGDDATAGHQEYATIPLWRISRVPDNLPGGLSAAVTVPCNLVTAFHTIQADLGLDLPWPIPAGPPKEAEALVLVWGAASSVGLFVVQVLRHWGYGNVLAVAAGKHHGMLEGFGARACFDYREEGVVERIEKYVAAEGGEGGRGGRPRVPYIVDCIGSLEGTLRPLVKIAEPGSKVAVMMPVINVHAEVDGQEPEYSMDVNTVFPGEWREGVELKGVRTFFYEKNQFFKNHLQPTIIPALLEQGVIQPNPQTIVEGKTMLERAQKALELLTRRAVSGEKLVWRVADDL